MTANPRNPGRNRGIRLHGGRLGLRTFAPALILLGCCVFAWGLRYKLSLYSHPHSFTHRMPEAKLLLPDRTTVPAAVLSRAAHRVAPPATSHWLPGLLVLAALTLCFAHERAMESGRADSSPVAFRGSSAFIRPPPRS